MMPLPNILVEGLENMGACYSKLRTPHSGTYAPTEKRDTEKQSTPENSENRVTGTSDPEKPSASDTIDGVELIQPSVSDTSDPGKPSASDTTDPEKPSASDTIDSVERIQPSVSDTSDRETGEKSSVSDINLITRLHPAVMEAADPPTKLDMDAESITSHTSDTKPHLHDLEWCTEKIINTVKTGTPVKVAGVPPEMHWLSPHIPKKGFSEGMTSWEEVELNLKVREKKAPNYIDGSKWLSLRLDGCRFGKLLIRLRKSGVISPGFDSTFAEAMQAVCQHLMKLLHAKAAYTQSDELTIIIEPAQKNKAGEQLQHDYKGNTAKLNSIIASAATGCFIKNIIKKGFMEKKIDVDDEIYDAKFDCRVGWYDSWEEARAILLWRASNCGINGISDAVFLSKVEGHKKMMGKNTAEKMLWLHQQGLLPLVPHQRHGSYYVATKRVKKSVNLQSGKDVLSLRAVIEHQDGNVLRLAMEDKLFPVNETLQGHLETSPSQTEQI